jgi:PAS domain S-box-containing protein
MHPDLKAKAAELDAPDRAVIVTTVEGTILAWSAGAEALYGWREEEVLGRQVLGVTPTNLSMGVGARIMSQLQAGVPWRGSFAVQSRSGEQMVVDVLDVPVRGERGELIGIVGVSRRAGPGTTPEDL